MENKELRPEITLALPAMLIRELKYNNRDNVDRIVSKRYMKELRNFKGEMNFTKKNIKALRDEELPDFNPGAFLQVSDVGAETLQKYGQQIFPEHYKKKKEKLQKKDSMSISSPASRTGNGDTTKFAAKKVTGGFSSHLEAPILKNKRTINIQTELPVESIIKDFDKFHDKNISKKITAYEAFI